MLCLNGTGSLNRWLREVAGPGCSYAELNARARATPPGAAGLRCLPFGNGAERVLGNVQVGAHLQNIDLNVHTTGHLLRAGPDGVAFAFRYGHALIRANGLHPTVVKAGAANMFLSDVFGQAFANATGLTVELYHTDGSMGAALGAGLGANVFATADEAFAHLPRAQTVAPDTDAPLYEAAYQEWRELLNERLQHVQQSLPVAV